MNVENVYKIGCSICHSVSMSSFCHLLLVRFCTIMCNITNMFYYAVVVARVLTDS